MHIQLQKVITMKWFLMMFLLMTLTACFKNTQYAKIPNEQWSDVSCNWFESWEDCKKAAKNLCPDGYYATNHMENYYTQTRTVSVACRG